MRSVHKKQTKSEKINLFLIINVYHLCIDYCKIGFDHCKVYFPDNKIHLNIPVSNNLSEGEMMSIKEEYSFTRYLSSKKSIDDRALNQHVWNTLYLALPEVNRANPLRVLEAGAGIGTMIERLVDWDLLTYAEYTAIDADTANVAEAQCRLSRWATENGVSLHWITDQQSFIQKENGQISLSYKTMDIYDFFGEENHQQDLLIAHAFMDLVDIPAVLSGFRELLRPGGLLYLTLNYDGETILLPSLHVDFDEQILHLYNKSMDDRIIDGRRSGDSKTGRHLFQHLQREHFSILATGSSDWIVYPHEQTYSEDEAYFLHFLVHTIRTELQEHPALNAQAFEKWVQKRHAQIERGELIYIAKHFDFLAQFPENSKKIEFISFG